MKKALIDLPVFLTFFIRDYTLEKVFSIIKDVRPSILFLVGDGPRPDFPEDVMKIEKCKKIFEDIDWDCKVYKYYSEENKGILQNTYDGLAKAFEVVDRIICLEDDMVPSKSFFYFCKELLEKYELDERVQGICGVNMLENYELLEADYFFSRYSASGALAYWKRTYLKMNFVHDYLESPYYLENLKLNLPFGLKRKIIKWAQLERKEYNILPKAKSIELFRYTNEILNSQLNIVPKRNLIKMIGVTPDSAHSIEDIKYMPKSIRRVHEMEAHEIDFPLKHPVYVIRDLVYEKEYRKIGALGFPLILLYRRIASVFLILRYGGPIKAISLILKKLEQAVSGLNKTSKNG